MRFFKKTIFWVIMLLVLSGIFYFFDEKVTQKEVAMEEKRRLFAFGPADVAGFELKKGDSVIAAKKGKNGWVIERPYITYADQTAVNDMLNRTVTAKIDGELFSEATKDKLKEMGLDPPYITVTIKTASGASTSLSLGDRGPTQNIAFAALSGNRRALRVHADVRSEVDKTIFDLRDKTVVAINPRELKRVELLWPDGRSISLMHPTENIWDADGLPAGKTDLTKVLRFLNDITASKAKAFIDENPNDLALYGLQQPRIKLRFIDSKNLLQTLLVGEKDRKLRGFYAKRGADRNVFLLEENFLDNLPHTVEELKE